MDMFFGSVSVAKQSIQKKGYSSNYDELTFKSKWISVVNWKNESSPEFKRISAEDYTEQFSGELIKNEI